MEDNQNKAEYKKSYQGEQKKCAKVNIMVGNTKTLNKVKRFF